ncbi:hypothetical protein DCAR_0414900 [Daucus carota subsp. sativus]|uniref:Uncharacterized protein n=1 Tax=Daucus carota subsp. sativus TaxID=79200 RepID=A0A165A344_DAUCS|nr:hypothetical protein DCAR_0414900 [Daucus carota subsp. sativus]
MLKEIHRALMIRIQKRRDMMLAREDAFCSTAMKKLTKRTSDGKVKEKEVAEASGKTMRLDTGGITGTNQASENNEQVEISQGVSQPIDNLQESQESIVQPTPQPSNTSQLQGGVFNRPFIRPGMANKIPTP